MPFTPSSAPPDVKRRFKGKCLALWAEVWNDTFTRHNDEKRAFATAETAGQNCKEAAKSMTDLAVKASGKDHIEGLAIPYTADIGGDTFGPDTDLCLDWFGPSGRPVLYDHGFDKAMKTDIIGRQVEYEERDEGLWIRAQLDQAAKYRKAIDKLIAEGALGFSSGAVDHLATKNADGHITRWPWMEVSLTTIPAHPGTTVYAVKAATAIAHLRAVDIEVPQPLEAALKALDEWADTRGEPPAGEPFADHAGRVLADVVALNDRARSIHEMRVKSGRVLSSANRSRIASAFEALAAVDDIRAELKALLDDTDPETAKSLDEAIWEALRTQARIAGAPV